MLTVASTNLDLNPKLNVVMRSNSYERVPSVYRQIRYYAKLLLNKRWRFNED